MYYYSLQIKMGLKKNMATTEYNNGICQQQQQWQATNEWSFLCSGCQNVISMISLI
jgi:hypothetical protein